MERRLNSSNRSSLARLIAAAERLARMAAMIPEKSPARRQRPNRTEPGGFRRGFIGISDRVFRFRQRKISQFPHRGQRKLCDVLG
jgi:hypothetical protein